MGQFISFYLPYSSRPGGSLSQAQAIANEAKALIEKGTPGVAITYSANYGQTVEIHKAYDAGDWNTHTSGLNQADVMREMETLLGSTETALEGRLQIAPITTMTYTDYGGHLHDEVIESDLAYIKSLLDKGWVVLGWQNQDSIPKYAVGGKISKMTSEQKTRIQTALSKLSVAYPESK